VAGIPDESLFTRIKDAGIKQYRPHDGVNTARYFTLEYLKIFRFRSKHAVDFGLGLKAGIVNRSRWAAGVADTVNYFGEPHLTWITYTISGRYLYYGYSSRLEYFYKINQYFSLGLSAGLHLPMVAKKFEYDDYRVYLGVTAKFRIF
jgi:hypothetical protein